MLTTYMEKIKSEFVAISETVTLRTYLPYNFLVATWLH